MKLPPSTSSPSISSQLQVVDLAQHGLDRGLRLGLELVLLVVRQLLQDSPEVALEVGEQALGLNGDRGKEKETEPGRGGGKGERGE